MTRLPAVLGRREVYSLSFGAIIGWGWVVLSGDLIQLAGSLGSALAFLAGAVLIGFVGLTYAELTSAMPRAGGELAFTYRALGPGWSWICGWALILAYVGVCAFEAVAVATVLDYLLPDLRRGFLYEVAGSGVYLSWAAAGSGTALLIGWINHRGLSWSARLQWMATAALLSVGVGFFLASNLAGRTENLQPWVTNLEGWLRALLLTPFLMIGFDVVPQTAEEIRVPPREIGWLLLLSIAMATAWYVLVQWGVGLSLPARLIRSSTLPTADAAAALLGSPWAGRVLVLGGLLGILTSWNAFFVAATRLLFSMGRAGMMPPFLSRLHPRFQTPAGAVLFVTGLCLPAPWLGREALVWLANVASLAAVSAFFLVAWSFLRLRRRAPEMARPYRVPGGVWVGRAALLISLAFFCLYLPPSPSALRWPEEWLLVMGWILLGGVAWKVVRRNNKADPNG